MLSIPAQITFLLLLRITGINQITSPMFCSGSTAQVCIGYMCSKPNV